MLSRAFRARGARVRVSFDAMAIATSPTCSNAMRRHLVAVASVRWNTSASSSVVPKADSDSDTASDASTNVTIDLGTVGAEDAKILTIADVLNAREREIATNKTLLDFEEWESIRGTVKHGNSWSRYDRRAVYAY